MPEFAQKRNYSWVKRYFNILWNQRAICLAIAAFFVLWPIAAFADSYLGLLYLIFPGSTILLVPLVVFIEGYLYRSQLGTSFGKSMYLSLLTNLFSTLLGIPVAFGYLMVSHYIPGDVAYSHLIYAFAPIVPFFFMSWWSEFWLLNKIHKDSNTDRVKWVCFKANLISYFILSVACMLATIPFIL